jgi:DmsE family decaheme c-type cytochrome
MRLVALIVAMVAFLAIVVQSADGQEVEYSREGADTCLSCHEDDTTLAIFKTRHAVPSDARGPFGHGQLQCEACHGPGGDHAGRVRRGQERPAIPFFGSTSTASVEAQNGQCLDCHNSDIGAGWHSGGHPVDEVACIDCHNSHSAVDEVLLTSTQPKVCFDCHQVVRSETMKAFSHPFFQGKMDCAGCHAPHGDNVATSLVHETVNDTCQSCHSQAGHPSIAYGTEGLASGMPSEYLLGQNCMNCHSQVHGSNHPSGSKLMR